MEGNLKNLDSVFAAYLIGCDFLRALSVAKRAAGLKEEWAALKERLQIRATR